MSTLRTINLASISIPGSPHLDARSVSRIGIFFTELKRVSEQKNKTNRKCHQRVGGGGWLLSLRSFFAHTRTQLIFLSVQIVFYIEKKKIWFFYYKNNVNEIRWSAGGIVRSSRGRWRTAIIDSKIRGATAGTRSSGCGQRQFSRTDRSSRTSPPAVRLARATVTLSPTTVPGDARVIFSFSKIFIRFAVSTVDLYDFFRRFPLFFFLKFFFSLFSRDISVRIAPNAKAKCANRLRYTTKEHRGTPGNRWDRYVHTSYDFQYIIFVFFIFFHRKPVSQYRRAFFFLSVVFDWFVNGTTVEILIAAASKVFRKASERYSSFRVFLAIKATSVWCIIVFNSNAMIQR